MAEARPYTRRSHAAHLWRHGILFNVTGLLWLVYGIFAAWRDEFVSEADKQKWKVLKLIPHLSFAWWLAISALALLALTFEASFRAHRNTIKQSAQSDDALDLKRREIDAQERYTAAIEAQIKQRENENNPLRMAIRKKNEFWAARLAGGYPEQPVRAEPSTPPQIEIRFEKRAPYEVSDIQQSRVLSTTRIGIKNSGGGALSNCRVYIEKISPEPSIVGGLPVLLNGAGFMVRHDDPEQLIDIATHWNHVQKFRFNAPGGHWAETLNYIDDSIERTIVIRIQATEGERRATFRLWTDEKKAIHLEFVGYAS